MLQWHSYPLQRVWSISGQISRECVPDTWLQGILYMFSPLDFKKNAILGLRFLLRSASWEKSYFCEAQPSSVSPKSIQNPKGNDHNCVKCLAIGSNIFGAIQLGLAVSIFHGLCVAEFPLEDAEKTYKIDLAIGTGGPWPFFAMFHLHRKRTSPKINGKNHMMLFNKIAIGKIAF